MREGEQTIKEKEKKKVSPHSRLITTKMYYKSNKFLTKCYIMHLLLDLPTIKTISINHPY